jgi:hypothetical protein
MNIVRIMTPVVGDGVPRLRFNTNKRGDAIENNFTVMPKMFLALLPKEGQIGKKVRLTFQDLQRETNDLKENKLPNLPERGRDLLEMMVKICERYVLVTSMILGLMVATGKET